MLPSSREAAAAFWTAWVPRAAYRAAFVQERSQSPLPSSKVRLLCGAIWVSLDTLARPPVGSRLIFTVSREQTAHLLDVNICGRGPRKNVPLPASAQVINPHNWQVATGGPLAGAIKKSARRKDFFFLTISTIHTSLAAQQLRQKGRRGRRREYHPRQLSGANLGISSCLSIRIHPVGYGGPGPVCKLTLQISLPLK